MIAVLRQIFNDFDLEVKTEFITKEDKHILTIGKGKTNVSDKELKSIISVVKNIWDLTDNDKSCNRSSKKYINLIWDVDNFRIVEEDLRFK